MPTAGEVLFNAGYHYSFARFMESGRFEARPFNPAARLTANPFTETEKWNRQMKGRYDFDQTEVNGDKVLERLGPFNPAGPNNPIWEAWCHEHGVATTWESYMDTKFVAKRQEMDDGEDYGTAWDLWISKTPVPGDGDGVVEEAGNTIWKLHEELKAAQEQTRTAQNVAAGLKLKLEGVQAALAKVKIKESGGGAPMGVLREIKEVVG